MDGEFFVLEGYGLGREADVRGREGFGLEYSKDGGVFTEEIESGSREAELGFVDGGDGGGESFGGGGEDEVFEGDKGLKVFLL